MYKKLAFLEGLTVLLFLSIIAYAAGAKTTDWTSTVAVFIGFLYSQLSFDIAEQQTGSHSGRPILKLAARMRSLFVLKEAIWITTFALLGSWPLLAGALMFMAYPMVRRVTRNGPIENPSTELVADH